MRSPRATSVFLMSLAICFLATSTVNAQTTTNAHAGNKPIFTDYEPLLCTGGGFVAMAGTGKSSGPLVVITIDFNGIEAPQTIPLTGQGVLGMECSESQIELLVVENQSNSLTIPYRHSIRLYTVQLHSDAHATIHEEQPEELDIPKIGPTPPALASRKAFLESQGRWQMSGNWYVGVRDVPDRPYRNYVMHFVNTDSRGVSTFTVTLLERTFGGKTITEVPLVHIERSESGE